MSLSDWNDKLNGGIMTLSTEQHYEGAKSLKLGSLSNASAIKILNKSETDLPKSVVVDFWGYITGYSGSQIAHFFRYQDIDNYYAVRIRAKAGAKRELKFYLREAGVRSEEGGFDISGAASQWNNWKIVTCEVSGVFYAQVYTKIADAWVLQGEASQSPAKFTGGGAYGVGKEDFSSGDPGYLDLTKVYY